MVQYKWRTVFLAAVAGVALAGCGGEEGATPTPPAGSPSGSPSQTPPNSAPQISGTPTTSVVTGTTYLFRATATDADNDTLTFSATGVPDWATFNREDGSLTGTPDASDAGVTAEIVVSVTDGEATASLPAFVITVTSPAPSNPNPPAPTNVAPQISGTPASSAVAGTAYTFTPVASDADSATLTFSITNRPAWASFSTATGRLSGTPTNAQARTYSNIVITVSDGALSASLPAFSITVAAAQNRAPTVSGTPGVNATVGSAYTFSPTASDPDGQTLTWSITNKPAWASFSTTTGRLSGTPGSANVGTTANITIRVSDGTLSASLAPFSLTVAAANRAPTISGTPATTATAGNGYSFTPSATDADADTLAFSISGKPAWATFSTATGALTGTPTAGTYANIVISVSDGKAAAVALPAFTITVSATQGTGTATLSWTAPALNTDNSALPVNDLAGYRVYHGTSANNLTDVVQVSGAANTSYTFSQLASGTHYFAVTAVTVAGLESAMSTVGSKTIP